MACRPHSKEMSTYFIPTNIEFVEEVAKAIARNRVQQDASAAIQEIIGKDIKLKGKSFERSMEAIFERLWNGDSPMDVRQRENYMNDALAAISAINLKLITSV